MIWSIIQSFVLAIFAWIAIKLGVSPLVAIFCGVFVIMLPEIFRED